MPRRPKPPTRSNNPAGRPSSGLSEGTVLVRGPELLLRAVADRARREGIGQTEAWRRAARVWLGWREELDPRDTATD